MSEQYPIFTDPEKVQDSVLREATREPMIIALTDYGLNGEPLVMTFHKGGRTISKFPSESVIEDNTTTSNKDK